MFGSTAKNNIEKIEVSNDVKEESTEDGAAADASDVEESDSEGGHEEGLYSSAQGGFG